ncbi:MAG: LppX_LprAFG lipoprotein [Chloroflexi bacterium]|nr:LppX_LprAFG lipoprotein [Chloroflexota bacterium]
MRRIALFLLVMMLSACAGQVATEAPPDARQLLAAANTVIRAVTTFRMTVEQSGAEYLIAVDMGIGTTEVAFRRAIAQFVAPDVMEASVRVILMGAPADINLFSRGDNQWFKLGTSDTWLNIQFMPGFNPASLWQDGAGFDRALNGLQNPQFVGAAELEDGTAVYHISGTSTSEDVAALTVGLIATGSDVNVDLYIDRHNNYPRRVVLVQPETVSQEEPEPTTWTIDVDDFNLPAQLNDPEAASASEATPTP